MGDPVPPSRPALPARPVKRVRQTIYVAEDLLDRLKDVAYWERVSFFTVCEEALRRELERRIQAHGGPYPVREPAPESAHEGLPPGGATP